MKFIPDAVGILVIALATFVGYLVMPEIAQMWIFAFLIFAAIGLLFWRDKQFAKTVNDWVGMAVGSVLVGAVFFAIDMVNGHHFRPDLSGISAASSSGSPFGFILTVFVCPCLTVLSLAGAARAYVDGGSKNDV